MRINQSMSRIGVFVAAIVCVLAGTVVDAVSASATPEYLWYINKNSGKCLEVFAFSQDNGGNVVQWDCWNGLNQQWLREDPDGDGWFQLRNRNSGKCLEVFAFSQDNGGNVVQWDCWGGVNQRWNDQVANPPIIR